MAPQLWHGLFFVWLVFALWSFLVVLDSALENRSGQNFLRRHKLRGILVLLIGSAMWPYFVLQSIRRGWRKARQEKENE